MKVIYLAGPMQACSDSQTHGWRADFKSAVQSMYTILDPSRRDYRGDIAWEPCVMRSLIENDKADIDGSDIVVANCWKPSYGTSMEILYAFERGKRVIVVHPGVGGSGSDRPSPWLIYHSERMFSTMEECVSYLMGVASHEKG